MLKRLRASDILRTAVHSRALARTRAFGAYALVCCSPDVREQAHISGGSPMRRWKYCFSTISRLSFSSVPPMKSLKYALT
eukprot:595232-Pleurochrysis_carterae.AAC.1